MRIGIVIWSFICSWCIIHSFGFYQEGNIDYAIIFGAAFMISLYLFIMKLAEYIKEDFFSKIVISLNQKEQTEDDEESASH